MVQSGGSRFAACAARRGTRAPILRALIIGVLGSGLGSGLADSQELPTVEQAAGPPVSITPRVGASITFTDNANLAPDGAERSDIIFTGEAGVTVEAATRRLLGYFSGDVSYDKFLDRNRNDAYRLRGSGGATAEFVTDVVFFDVRGAVTERNASRSSVAPATNRSFSGDRTRIVNYSAGPRVERELGDFAVGRLSAQVGQVIISRADSGQPIANSGDSTIFESAARLESGRRFSRLGWAVDGQLVETDDDFQRQTGFVTASYAATPAITPFVRVGYENIDDPEIVGQDVDGVFWSVGARYRPGRRLYMEFEGGRRYDGPSYSGQVRYEFSQSVVLSGFYEEGIETQQTRLNRNLNRPDFFSEAARLAESEGLLGPNDAQLDILDRTFKEKRANITLSGTRGRNYYGATAFYVAREFFASGEDEETAGIGVRYRRNLSRRLTGAVSGSFSDTVDSRTANSGSSELRFTAGLDYQVGEGLFAAAEYAFQSTERDNAGDVSENAVVLSVIKTF